MVLSDKYNIIESRLYEGQQQPLSDSKVGSRNLIGLMVDGERRNSNCNIENNDHSPSSTYQEDIKISTSSNNTFIGNTSRSTGTILKFTSDENRNSIIEAHQTIDYLPTSNICEVITTEITERKTKKKSALQNFRNLVKTTVVTLETSSQHTDANLASSSSSSSQQPSCWSDGQPDANKMTNRKQRKNKGLAKYRKKKNRRSRVIPNEGAPLWQPMVIFFICLNHIKHIIFKVCS